MLEVRFGEEEHHLLPESGNHIFARSKVVPAAVDEKKATKETELGNGHGIERGAGELDGGDEHGGCEGGESQ